jgi:hypothetical protein
MVVVDPQHLVGEGQHQRHAGRVIEESGDPAALAAFPSGAAGDGLGQEALSQGLGGGHEGIVGRLGAGPAGMGAGGRRIGWCGVGWCGIGSCGIGSCGIGSCGIG